MRLEKYLQEKYMGSKKTPYRKAAYSVYENPTMLEMNMALEESLLPGIRFIADDLNKKVFVWSSEAIHAWIWNDFLAKTYAKGREPKVNISPGLLPGMAEKKGNKFVMVRGDQIIHSRSMTNSEWSDEIFKIDWKWADKYVNVTKWLKKNYSVYGKG